MKGLFIKHAGAFRPFDDETYERFKRVKEGKAVEMQFTQKRDLQFHKRYFSLINTAWAYLNEDQEKMFGTLDGFRKTITLNAGFYEPILDLQEQRFIRAPKSIAFDKMSQEEFEELYSRTKDILFQYILTDISEDEFLANLIDY